MLPRQTFIPALSLLFTLSLGAVVTHNAETDVLDPAPEADTAAAVNPAVSYWSYTDRACGGSGSAYTTSDVQCFTLPGNGLRIRSIASTCRSEIFCLLFS
jgi:hypothetical protein